MNPLKITQALVAIGGRATRIRRAGVPVPVSKSFLPLCGKPMLYWNLRSMHLAGIRRLILCGNEEIHLKEAELLLDSLGVSFERVEMFRDAGLGVHGLPFQVMEHHPGWLDRSFLFECGHSFVSPDLYRQIAELKGGENVVFSAFKPHPANSRQPVRLDGKRVKLIPQPNSRSSVLAHPTAVDTRYAQRLPALNFRIDQIIRYYSSRKSLRYAFSEMPPEFDLVDEMNSALPVYEAYLRDQGLVRSGCGS